MIKYVESPMDRKDICFDEIPYNHSIRKKHKLTWQQTILYGFMCKNNTFRSSDVEKLLSCNYYQAHETIMSLYNCGLFKDITIYHPDKCIH